MSLSLLQEKYKRFKEANGLSSLGQQRKSVHSDSGHAVAAFFPVKHTPLLVHSFMLREMLLVTGIFFSYRASGLRNSVESSTSYPTKVIDNQAQRLRPGNFLRFRTWRHDYDSAHGYSFLEPGRMWGQTFCNIRRSIHRFIPLIP